ncbi:IclR family transcriptional regulator [Paracoccus wurundjeri]|uniref:IclR family transcriptional regulator n=1 Tax=Paracoccus onubensis TaxID=1675788 RepID=UPI00272F1C2A|nr:IclR family transcriptional regulator [Paracoccus onubensis]
MEESSGSQSIERATNLLALVAQSHATGSTLNDLVRSSGLKQATARRLLLALIRAGLVSQDEGTRRYHLGLTAYLYGTIATDSFADHMMADEAVRRLAERSEDTAFFSVRQGLHTLCMRREEGLHPIRSHVLNIGQRHPLGVAAHGIAILASLPDAEVEMISATHRAYYDSHYPMLTEDVLRQAIAEARRRGCAINRGIFHRGAWAISVAVHGPSGQVIGALSIGAIEDRLNEQRQPEIIAMLKSEARKLESRFSEVALHLNPTTNDGAVTRRRINGSERTPS